jgi:hypothetical protein
MHLQQLLRGLHLSAMIAACTLTGHVHACDLGRSLPRSGVLKDVQPGLPSREAVRVVGVVTGYGTVDRAVGRRPNAAGIATLRVRIDDVVSGRIGKGEAEIVPIGVVADCSSKGSTPELLREGYPVGATLVVLGEAIVLSESGPVAIVAEANQGGFAAQVPPNVRRIASGELDFSASLPAGGGFMDFEFDRALLMLADAPPAERFARLRNLASYPYSYHAFRDADREFYSRLITGSGMTAQQRDQLLRVFDDPATTETRQQ